MRKTLAALLLLLSPLASHAADEPAMLWVAEGENNRVYFLGSIHVLRATDHPLPDIIEVVYQDAEQLIMELDMDDIDPMAALQFLTQRGVLQGDETLRDRMGAELYERAEASAREIDIPIELLSQAEPWLAAMTVQEMLMMRVGFEAEYGIEMYLTSKAQADEKPIAGLESISEQLGFLDGLSNETQSLWFLQSIVEGRRMEMLVDELVVAWRKGDIAFLEAELLHEMNTHPELHESILVQRNKNWIAPIMDLLDDEDDYLVVVGAAHLVGKDGVPDLLSQQGVRIKQLHDSVQ